jgi:hypothetical protein
MSQDQAKQATEKIIEELDKTVLLGAAYDCMSDAGKAKLCKKIEKIIEEECL